MTVLDKILATNALLETDAGVLEALVSAYHIYVMNHPRFRHEGKWSVYFDGGELHDRVVRARERRRMAPTPYVTLASSRHEERPADNPADHLSVVLMRGKEITHPTPRHRVTLAVHHGLYNLTYRQVVASNRNLRAAYELEVNHELISLPGLQTMARSLGDITLEYMNNPHITKPTLQVQPGFTLVKEK